MLVRCAWCKKELGEKDPIEDKRITDGICAECAEKLLEQAPEVYDGEDGG